MLSIHLQVTLVWTLLSSAAGIVEYKCPQLHLSQAHYALDNPTLGSPVVIRVLADLGLLGASVVRLVTWCSRCCCSGAV